MRLLIIFLFANQLTLGQTNAVKLHSFQNSTCDEESDPYRLRIRIVSRTHSKDILTVQIASTATCCVKFIPKTTYKNEVLDLDFEETGDPCECTCCYEFVYEIKGVKSDNIKITFRGKEIEQSDEKYKTHPVQFEIKGGDTINYTDKYGLRQGLWVSNTSMSYFEYHDDLAVRNVKLYPSGKIQSEMSREKTLFMRDGKEQFGYTDFNRYVEYFESGQKRKECYDSKKVYQNYYTKGKCKEWNEKGELVYEGDYRE